MDSYLICNLWYPNSSPPPADKTDKTDAVDAVDAVSSAVDVDVDVDVDGKLSALGVGEGTAISSSPEFTAPVSS